MSNESHLTASGGARAAPPAWSLHYTGQGRPSESCTKTHAKFIHFLKKTGQNWTIFANRPVLSLRPARHTLLCWVISVLLCASSLLGANTAAEPLKVIFDTDVDGDNDDVAAAAILHAFADAGRV